MPKLRDWLRWDHIDILKLDCEGCEIAFARDILRGDPTYLHHVDQISLETHVTKTWVATREEVYYFGLHFALMEEAGFVMEWSQVFGCSKRHEVEGCMPEFQQYGYPCGYKDWPGGPSQCCTWQILSRFFMETIPPREWIFSHSRHRFPAQPRNGERDVVMAVIETFSRVSWLNGLLKYGNFIKQRLLGRTMLSFFVSIIAKSNSTKVIWASFCLTFLSEETNAHSKGRFCQL